MSKELIIEDELIEDSLTTEEQVIEEWEEEDSEILDPNNQRDIKENQIRIIRSNSDYNLDFLKHSIDKNIDLGPSFQRRPRWSIFQKSLLIESLLMNLPIPPIFLYEKEYYNYEVVDGRQRLETIKEFLENQFRLQGLKYWTQLNRKKFSEIDNETQRLLYRRTISATILLAESERYDKADIRMILFDRLNTGGTKLNAQELRNAIFPGSFNELIIELSSNNRFREIWGMPDPDSETNSKIKDQLSQKLRKNKIYRAMVDCELVLRFFAINEVTDSKANMSGSMRDLLDKTMRKYQNATTNTIDTMRSTFLNALEKLYDIFGRDAFKNTKIERGGKARNLYDSLTVGCSQINLESVQSSEIIRKNLSVVLNSPEEYEKIITKGNSIDNIKYRVEKAKQILTSNLS